MKLTFQLATALLTPLLITAPMRAAIQSPELPLSSQLHISLIDRDSDTAPTGSKTVKGFIIQVADSSGAPAAESAVVFRLPDEGATGSFADAAHSAIVYTAADGIARVSGIQWSDTPGPVAIKVTATRGDLRAGILLHETLTPLAAPLTSAIPNGPVIAPRIPEPPPPALQIPAAVTVVPLPQPGVLKANTALPRLSPVSPAPVQPSVSVVNTKQTAKGYHSSHKKWIILIAVVAGAAGAGLALGGKSKSAASTASTTPVSVGSPTVSVGLP